MTNYKYILFLLILLFFSPLKSGQESLTFHGAYTFETFSQQKACAVYVSIFNNTEKDFIISSVSTDIAEKAEIHGIVIQKEITKMKKMENLLIKSKQQVFLQPGGIHLMLMGLKHQLKDGSSFDVRFILGDGSFNEVKVMVLNKKMRENFIE